MHTRTNNRISSTNNCCHVFQAKITLANAIEIYKMQSNKTSKVNA